MHWQNAAASSRDPLAFLRITGKFPGYLSPSAGLKFADVPNGLAAISKATGFVQWQWLELFKMLWYVVFSVLADEHSVRLLRVSTFH